jgi:hypothetical protein
MSRGLVFIVESPSANDLLDDRVEGRALCSALQLAEIPHAYSLVTTRKALEDSLFERLPRLMQLPQFLDRLPILHLSMHGNNEGVGLTDGNVLTWDELRELITPLMNVMSGGLLICMSSCFGIGGCRMVMNQTADHPFWAIIGNKQDATWANAAVAYITFYHQFFKDNSVLDNCVNVMKQASGDTNFVYLSGHAVKLSWIASLTNTKSTSVVNALSSARSEGASFSGGLLGTFPQKP